MSPSSHSNRLIFLSGILVCLLITASCMKNKPESLPENLVWNPQLALPLGEEEFGMNSSSGFDTLLLEEDSVSALPLWTGQYELVMEGVFNFDLSTISDNLDKLNRILFRINCSNEFPQTLYSQAYFRDGSGIYLDSMFLEGPAETPAASVSDGGATIEPGLAQHDALIEGERIPGLAGAQTILFRTSFLVIDVDSSLISSYPTFRFHIDSGFMLDLSFED